MENMRPNKKYLSGNRILISFLFMGMIVTGVMVFTYVVKRRDAPQVGRLKGDYNAAQGGMTDAYVENVLGSPGLVVQGDPEAGQEYFKEWSNDNETVMIRFGANRVAIGKVYSTKPPRPQGFFDWIKELFD